MTRWKKGHGTDFPSTRNDLVNALTQADNGVGTVKVDKKRMDLPKIGWVRMREELRYTGEIIEGCGLLVRMNRWFVSDIGAV